MYYSGDVLVANIAGVIGEGRGVVVTVVLLQERLELVDRGRVGPAHSSILLDHIVICFVLYSGYGRLMRQGRIEPVSEELAALPVEARRRIDLSHYVLEARRLAIDGLGLPHVDVDLVAGAVLPVQGDLLYELGSQVIFVRLIFGILNCAIFVLSFALAVVVHVSVRIYKRFDRVHLARLPHRAATVDAVVMPSRVLLVTSVGHPVREHSVRLIELPPRVRVHRGGRAVHLTIQSHVLVDIPGVVQWLPALVVVLLRRTPLGRLRVGLGDELLRRKHWVLLPATSRRLRIDLDFLPENI